MKVMSAILADTYTNEIEEHKKSAVGHHLYREQHEKKPDDTEQSLRILRKCRYLLKRYNSAGQKIVNTIRTK